MILSSLNHPNILSIKAQSSQNGVEEYHTGRHNAFFLVLERLEETLSQKLEGWRTYCIGYVPSSSSLSSSSSQQGFFSKMLAKNLPRTRRLRQNETLRERSQVVLDLAGAISYLHEKRIIHRDLKPDNIGFNYDGVLKVLNFDVAKILPKTNGDCDDDNVVFHMTQRIGSIQYMSPECAMGRPYNCKTDVYSFGLICHEVLTLERPFDHLTRKHDMDEKVFIHDGLRPSIPNSWPDEMYNLISNCWSDDLTNLRPAMKRVVPQLQMLLPSFVQQQQSRNKKVMTKKVIFGATATAPTRKRLGDEKNNESNLVGGTTMSNSAFTSAVVVATKRQSITSILFPPKQQEDQGEVHERKEDGKYEKHEHEENQRGYHRHHNQQEQPQQGRQRKSRVDSFIERMAAVAAAAAAASSSALYHHDDDDDDCDGFDGTMIVSSQFLFAGSSTTA